MLSELGGVLGLPADIPAGRVLDLLSSPVVLVILAGVTGILLARCAGAKKEVPGNDLPASVL